MSKKLKYCDNLLNFLQFPNFKKEQLPRKLYEEIQYFIEHSCNICLFLPGFCGVSCFFVILARFTPYEWDNPYPEVEEPEELENQFRSKTSAYFN